MKKKIVKTIIHSVRDSDIHMPNNSTQDTWDWLLQCAEAHSLLANHLDLLDKIKIKDDYNFQYKMLNFVSRQMGVRIEYETECYIKQ